jgi:hypothetical protein
MTQAYFETEDILQTAIANNSPAPLTNLYDYDFNLWVEATANLLHSGKLTEIDVVNLLEEVESFTCEQVLDEDFLPE